MPKWKESKKASPPPDPEVPAGYEKYIATNEDEANDLAVEANGQAGMKEPTVKHLSHIVIKDGSENGRPEHTFLKRIIKKGALAIAILLLCSSNVFAARSDSGLDETIDFHTRKVGVDLTEVYALTREGAVIRQDVREITAAAELTLATGDYYTITGDTTITSIALASTWRGRKIILGRSVGSTTTVQLSDGNNLILEGNLILGAGDTATLLALDETYWYMVSSGDN